MNRCAWYAAAVSEDLPHPDFTNLGQFGICVNAISAGTFRTLASSALSGISGMIKATSERAPLRKATGTDEVEDGALFFLSPLSRRVSGEILFVVGGYHVLGV